MEEKPTESTARIQYLDMIRLAAMAAVIMIHATAPILKEAEEHSTVFFWANFFESISRLGVPLFLMISGALILDQKRNYTFSKIWKRAGKILILLYGWSLFYGITRYLLLPNIMGEPISLKAFVMGVIIGQYHLWYLFVLLGLTLITPVLKKFVCQENRKIVSWLILLTVIFKFCIPVPNMLLGHFLGAQDLLVKYRDLFHMGFLSEFLAYYLLGWLLVNFEPPVKIRRICYVLGIGSLIFTIAAMNLWKFQIPNAENVIYDNGSLNILLYTLAVFLFLQVHFKHLQKISWVEYAARISFGIYLIHPFFLGIFCRIVVLPNALLTILVNWLLTLGASALTSAIFYRIPWLRKTITM